MVKLTVGLLILSCLHIKQGLGSRDVGQLRRKRQAFDPTERRIVCYYADWAPYRKNDSKFVPDDINPQICTHLVYAYARFDEDQVSLEPFDLKQDIELKGYEKFVGLKDFNPKLKVILSVGGSKEGSARFSKIAGDPRLRVLFAKNSKSFLKQFNFDGLDLVWKYPNFTEGSSFSDKNNYVEFVKELRKEYKDEYSISMVVPQLVELVDRGFNVPELSKYVDFMTVLTYDYHSPTQPSVGHPAPLYSLSNDPGDHMNIDASIKVYENLDVDMFKLNLALPFFGIIFILDDPDNTDIGADTEDEGEGTQERGADIYNNFCKRIRDESWTIRHVNKSALGPYAYKGKLWIAYDDEDMIRTKARYAAMKNLGGLMIWGVDMDDFKGLCHPKAFPLVKAARETFMSQPRRQQAKAIPRPTTSTTTTTTPTPTRRQTTERSRTMTRTMPSTTDGMLLSVNRPTTRKAPSWNTVTDPTPDSFPDIPGANSIYSNRDIIFQNIKIWVSNHFYDSQKN